ncbi:hypothetical protein IF1G_09095 [Cordyceps javanica]|uniref:Alba domain-containing protein n=1 Tax=Cordyceps javanica TaxID=43265 RepID=A0A545VR26_9HYPO|nr:hypothetical protein IF1G_09095 [Cordyceps javanica]TQW04191.1 hypothetical protein IF2G_08505 [Cordyceps javanica]
MLLFINHQTNISRRFEHIPLSRILQFTKGFLPPMPAAAAAAAVTMDHVPKKRKPSTSSVENSSKKARSHTNNSTRAHKPSSSSPPPLAPPAQDSPLCKPHVSILEELSGKYNVLLASVISSTPIRKRLVHITTHLLDGTGPAGTAPPDDDDDDDDDSTNRRGRPRVVLLHARTAEVCKMITVAEKCKRLLEQQQQQQQGQIATWFQYNQLFDLPQDEAERITKRKSRGKKTVVEETVLQVDAEVGKDNDDDDDDDDDDDESDAFETMQQQQQQSRFEKAVLPPLPVRTIKSLRIFLSTVPIPELKTKDGVTVQTSAN